MSLHANEPKIYVGNLPYNVSQADIEDHFQAYGAISDVKIITDRETGRSKGFGFVTFESAEGANNALAADGKELNGRSLRVSIAQPKKDDDRGRGGRR